MFQEDIQFIIIHCSATSPTQDIGASDIDTMHRAKGWSAIGYHKVIKRDATIENGRDLNVQGAHVKGHNHHSWGICLIGGVDKDNKPESNFTLQQYLALSRVVSELTIMAPSAIILGHRDLSPDLDGDGIIEQHEWLKECPCFNVPAFFDEP